MELYKEKGCIIIIIIIIIIALAKIVHKNGSLNFMIFNLLVSPWCFLKASLPFHFVCVHSRQARAPGDYTTTQAGI
jgi:hypothetical protein